MAKDDPIRLQRLTGRMGAADLARTWMASPEWQTAPGSEAAGHAMPFAISDARATAAGLRSREAIAVTRASPIAALTAAGADARDWLAAARVEEEAPVLIMIKG